MKTPYQVLGVANDADDAEIKQAYLRQVKINPPDHHPEAFQRLNRAYEAIKDHKSRLNYELFSFPEADFDALLDQALKTADNLAISPQQFQRLLDAGLDDAKLLDTLSRHAKS